MKKYEMISKIFKGTPPRNKNTETSALRHGAHINNVMSATRRHGVSLFKFYSLRLRVSRGLAIFVLALSAVSLAPILSGCGNPGINLNNAPYNPKIAVEGYLYPGHTITHISLMRNYPIGDSVTQSNLYLTPSENNVSATINGVSLTFDPQTQTYYNNQTVVDYNKSYTLEVFATIDGKQLHTTSLTTTPQKGFSVLDNSLGNFSYGDSITINYFPSPGTGFYAFSIVPDTASTKNFIYNNNYRDKLDSSKVADNLNDYEFRYGTVDNINSYAGTTYSYNIGTRNTWFYSAYTVIAYACDQNFKDYILTAPTVQEVNGNFHEPIETFQGDGIGVFGSAIADTVRFEIVK